MLGLLALLSNLLFFSGYIKNKNCFPHPLPREKEEELLAKYKAGDRAARDELINHNMRLVVHIAKKYSASAEVEELISVGSVGLIKAVENFTSGKGTHLATYAARCIENEILMHLRKISNAKYEMSFDEPLSIDWDGNELTLRDVLGSEPDEISSDIEYNDEKALLLKIILGLPEKERELMKKRFGILGETEHTQKELADLMGISQSYISRLEKRIIGKIKAQMMKEYV